MTKEQRRTVAFMGPAGTFSHIAAKRAYPDAVLVETATLPAAIDRVEQGAADLAIVPIENSTEGGVSATLDALVEGSLQIQGEVVIDVALCLAARHVDRALIRRVLSHPQPLAQCRHWLACELPQAALISMASTSVAAREAAADDATAAVTSALAVEIYGLVVVAENIQDREGNATRFVIVGQSDAAATGHDKTTLVFSTPHERGALRRALGVFDDEGINLTRIESRPAPDKRWEYVFVADLEGHRSEPNVARAVAALSALCSTVRVLGSYPRAV